MYYAHIRGDGTKQTVEEHLNGTGERCAIFASAFGEEKRGKLLGQAHDIGKCSEAFQNRLLGGQKVDHATAGALECAKIREDEAACCILGHHGGLPDFGNPRTDYPGIPTCVGRIKNGKNGGIPSYRWEGTLPAPGKKPPFPDSYALSMWMRMLYSCLVDADYLDTEAFMAEVPPERQLYDSLPVLLERLENHVRPWFPGTTELNQNRCAILSQCQEKASQPRGIYFLTVPTGGGKTVSSLAFALKHAVENHMQRVIYVIPYTSIIEQNAAVFRKILGDNNVVEHHSGISFDEDGETSRENRYQRLAAENWDAPVIVTTAVQFFESLYANRPSKCRKLHNIANSVVIFDEAQMLPNCHLLPCVGAMASLVSQFRSTILLCTATQPALSDLFQRFCPQMRIQELCPNVAENFRKFQRVTYRNGGSLSNDALTEELQQHSQVLCIVNTRQAAQELYARLPEEGRFHLSTLMYPQHRKEILRTIRERLEQGLPCRVVSTSLIEAGVDVDFPAVYREMAGLDSIAQAAGRCNREGKNPASESIVTYFQSENPIPTLQKQNIQAAREALKRNDDPGDPATMGQYFTALRSWIGSDIDKEGMIKAFQKGVQGRSLPFDTMAGKFHMIDNDTRTVYIPLGDGEIICNALREQKPSRELYRKAGQFAVNIYDGHYQALLYAGDIQTISDDSAVLTNLELYNSEMGLSTKADIGKANFV